MDAFILLSKPWWVNLFILAPFIAFFFWKNGLAIQWRTLFFAMIFGISFGYVEGTVVVYLREAFGDVSATSTAHEIFRQSNLLEKLPGRLIMIEVVREIATIVMLLSIAFLSVQKFAERFAIFFWSFAFWDISYYFSLWLAIGWPNSFTTSDILFLIPVPWRSQVWYPILISSLFIIAILLRKKYVDTKKSSSI